MISLKYCVVEEIRQMDIHKWLESEKACRDLGQDAYFDWIKKYAKPFRAWANYLPAQCISCGLCKNDSSSECWQPFHEARVRSFLNAQNQKILPVSAVAVPADF